MNKLKKVLKKEKGFTLIELLIVIAIIAILAILIIPRVSDSLDKAENNTSEANMKLVQSAVERYILDNDGTEPLKAGASPSNTIDLEKLVDEGYIDEAPAGVTLYLVDGVVSTTSTATTTT